MWQVVGRGLGWEKWGSINPKLERRSAVLLLLLLLCHAQGTPPGFWNGVDLRALVELRPPNIGKLRGSIFFGKEKNPTKNLKKKVIFGYFFWDFRIFLKPFWKLFGFLGVFMDFFYFFFNFFLDFLDFLFNFQIFWIFLLIFFIF